MSKFLDENGLQYFWSKLKTSLNNKVDKITGKGLSTEDYTTAEKTKLAGIASGAEVNVQSDWNQTDSSADDFIKNKPTVPTVDQTFDATSQNAQSGVAIASVLGGATVYKSNTIRVNFNYYPATIRASGGAASNSGYVILAAGRSWIDAGGSVDIPDGIYLAFINGGTTTLHLPIQIMVSRARSARQVFIGAGIMYGYYGSAVTVPSSEAAALDENTVYVRIGDYPS